MDFNVKLFPFKLKYFYQNLITSTFYYNSPANRVLKYSYQSIIIWKTFFLLQMSPYLKQQIPPDPL